MKTKFKSFRHSKIRFHCLFALLASWFPLSTSDNSKNVSLTVPRQVASRELNHAVEQNAVSPLGMCIFFTLLRLHGVVCIHLSLEFRMCSTHVSKNIPLAQFLASQLAVAHYNRGHIDTNSYFLINDSYHFCTWERSNYKS